MTFNIGDRVRIATRRFEGNSAHPHYGLYGNVIGIGKNQEGVIFLVKRDAIAQNISDIYYLAEDLEFVKTGPIMDPDFSLEEIELGNDIYAAVSAQFERTFPK